MHIATPSNVPIKKIPINMPLTFNTEENSPHLNKLFVSPAA